MRRWLPSTVFVIISVGAATLLTFPLQHVTTRNLGLFYTAAVMLTAMYEGAPAGIATALLSTLAFDWFFDRRPYHLDFNLAALIRAVAFCSFALLVAWLEQQRQRALSELRETNQSLQRALDEVKTLRGLLPICVYCKQIRDDGGRWVRLETYVRDHTEADFTHGLCPECYQKHYPEIYEKHHPSS